LVNASLNWASIVGIVLAVCGAGLYFLRSFKPALARDYDVFFAAIGLLCGGILFFQGWRLDPILQFGQFLLAGTTVFFAYESVRLRGVATDQARRSSYFDEESSSPRGSGSSFRDGWDDSFDQFEDSPPLNRRFSGRRGYEDQNEADENFGARRISRAAIPEQAASRRFSPRESKDSWRDESQSSRRRARFDSTNSDRDSFKNSSFGERRSLRDEQRRGSRPTPTKEINRRRNIQDSEPKLNRSGTSYSVSRSNSGFRRGSSSITEPEEAAFSSTRSSSSKGRDSLRKSPQNESRYGDAYRPSSSSSNTRNNDNSSRSNSENKRRNSSNLRPRQNPRDNSSRFDD